ncbi:putative thiamine transport system substrate-binding protein [Roseibium hamelinense]|uniref:Putative thiamine transport system substrate-binding protein n=1 Tax=Roseibium hamelinense TaxID=150831 RepID=A0A562SHJ9_9HYPH|nr:ABC transporter substrate-binding protein [Roseibium hamelinense]MTI43954.1 ABC transporter substrate-binding protein [Roseibium hamelinense]TWI80751.1 putative thiamine transport system substrate-binding protein [Roseibium hamelinense]
MLSKLYAAGVALAVVAASAAPAAIASNGADSWSAIEQAANGQTVYFHAWGGEPRINAYIAWAAETVKDRYGVTVEHVKVSETAGVVTQIVAEKTAGRTSGGTVDLVWINGENFNTLKTQGLLAEKGWAETLPNWQYVDVEGKPTVVSDFTVPTDGQESPWGMAQLVFMHDSARLPEPPKSLSALAEYANANPGRITYPQPPNFHGSTFLKQALITLIDDPQKLQSPVVDTRLDQDLAPLFAYLDDLHPHLWRSAEAFPQNAAQMRQLLADGEIDIAFTFNPGDASSAIANGELPPTVRSFVLEGGTIGNTHFVAIPFNSSAQEGAKVLANFLLSAEAQARKQDPAIWGDPTVLKVTSLQEADQKRFEMLELGVATLSPTELGQTLPEPHPSWVKAVENAWAARYGGS